MIPTHIITLDGPSASGKGAIGMLVADALRSTHVDTGALFRAAALLYKQHNSLDFLDDYFQKHTLADLYAMKDLRTNETGELASQIATHPEVRALLLRWIRTLVVPEWSVFDGRDCGTVMFPSASIKLFITASAEVRAKRRHLQLQAQGVKSCYSEILNMLEQRDERDRLRPMSPTLPAEDAVILDTSFLDLDESIALALKTIEISRSKC